MFMISAINNHVVVCLCKESISPPFRFYYDGKLRYEICFAENFIAKSTQIGRLVFID